MNTPEILEKLQTVFDSIFLDEVTVTESLTAEQVEEWDSLTHISLIVAVEREFGIRFRTGEVEGTSDVGDFVALISEHLEARTTA